MSEPSKAVAFKPGSGQIQEKPSPQEEEKTAAQPEFITREEAKRMADEAAEAAFRRAQGLFDRGNQKVRERLGQLEDTFKLQAETGVELSDDQKEKMRQRVIQQTLTETESPSTAEPSKEQPAQTDPAKSVQPEKDVDPITQTAWQMMEEAGVVIEDGDPEVAMLDHSNPYKFFRSIEAAIAAKQKRTSAKMPTNLGGFGTHKANPIEDVTDPRELLKMGLYGGK